MKDDRCSRARAPARGHPDHLAAFGARLSGLRRARRLSQVALAERAGMTRAGLSRLEGGVRWPTAETLGRLAAVLGVDSESLRRSLAGG